MSGTALFARYAFPPNELGYCGPDGAELLLGHGHAEAAAGAEVTRRAPLFDGAWVYLELIAAAAGITDPLDERVVEAYWIGNELLELVDQVAAAHSLRSRFQGQVTSRLANVERAVPHHSFHVFAVYPWLAMLGRGNDAVALSVLERCRIRPADVLEVRGEQATVSSQSLVYGGHQLSLGPAREELVRWSTGDSSLVRDLAAGDQVALHWNWVCDVLDARQLTALQDWSGAVMRGLSVDAATAETGPRGA
jgi:hypothetical protein